jgi:hypothetical protein
MAIRAAASGDYLIRTTGSFYDPTAMTVCFWINLLIDKDASGAVFGLRNLSATDGSIYFYNSPPNDGTGYGWQHISSGGGATDLDRTDLTLGVWTFIALSRAGTGLNQTTAYRRTAGSTAFTSATGTFNTGQTIQEEVVLSRGFNLASGWFPGRIAALKQWSAALTADEIWQESQQIMPARFANLHSWRPMVDSAVAGAALDYSGAGRHLTPNGALTIEDGPPIPWRQGARRSIQFTPSSLAPVNIDGNWDGYEWDGTEWDDGLISEIILPAHSICVPVEARWLTDEDAITIEAIAQWQMDNGAIDIEAAATWETEITAAIAQWQTDNDAINIEAAATWETEIMAVVPEC